MIYTVINGILIQAEDIVSVHEVHVCKKVIYKRKKITKETDSFLEKYKDVRDVKKKLK